MKYDWLIIVRGRVPIIVKAETAKQAISIFGDPEGLEVLFRLDSIPSVYDLI